VDEKIRKKEGTEKAQKNKENSRYNNTHIMTKNLRGRKKKKNERHNEIQMRKRNKRRRRKHDTYFERMITKNEIRIDDFLKEDGRLNIMERREKQT